MTVLQQAGGFLQRLVLPVDCAGCGLAGPTLCAGCRAALAPGVLTRSVAGIAVTSALEYDDVVRRVVVAFKNDGATALAGPLAIALRHAVGAALPEVPAGTMLLPMPRTRRSAAERGYDPVRLLLRRGRLPHHGALRLVRRADDQLALGREGRFANLAEGMRARDAVTGRTVLLVDDVVTTGATLSEAARAVTAAGGHVLGAATLASTPLRSSRARLP